MRTVFIGLAFALAVLPRVSAAGAADAPAIDASRGDKQLAAYFQAETAKISQSCLADVKTLSDWTARREEYHRQLQEMLGLLPWPEKTELKPVVTGKVDHAEFTVENLHFQSRPGLYVTGNLYVPKGLAKPAPTILYVCGHSVNKKGDISYGNKAGYQHHGAWFARHGYVCLTVDTLQLGEIEGIHHGTHRENMWWWLNRGYTPAGVEAWNCVRALDYLETRSEVDKSRFGVTGRSGGGAYSWWIAALDNRIKVAVPVAGITDLENHVVDGAVEGHCDCMFMFNTYRWDYAQVAALVAPRPLLISNTDKDRIFPLDGVMRVHEAVRKIYRLHDAADKLGLQITEGPHKDTQELHIHAFVWFNRFLKGESPPIDKTAVKFFEPEQLRVFHGLPADSQNARIHESFVPTASPAAIPADAAAWAKQREDLLTQLKDMTFRAWPAEPGPLDVKSVFSLVKDGMRFSAHDFTSQQHVSLRLYVAHRENLEKPELTVLNVVDDAGWLRFLATMRSGFAEQLAGEARPATDDKSYEQTKQMFQSFPWAMAYVAPRGVGPTTWDQSEKKQTQVRRRYMLLGQSLEGMQTFDVRRAMQAARSLPAIKDSPLWLQADGPMAAVALYASLFEPPVKRLDLHALPKTHRNGPILLNVDRILGMPQTVALAAERSQVIVYQDGSEGWDYPSEVVKSLGWDAKSFRLRADAKR